MAVLKNLVAKPTGKKEKKKTHIPKIQRGINLIHDIQGRGAIDMQRKDQSETAQRLLAATEVADVLPAQVPCCPWMRARMHACL